MTIGIICEYNPFHNGHVYHIQKIKEKYPNSTLVLVLNGYFLERGEISILSKEAKTKIALFYGVDIILELPVLYGTQSADKFAECSITLLNALNVEKIIFGSETCNIPYLEKLAKKQLEENFKISRNNGNNYPRSLNQALEEENKIAPNDLLGISYIKAILKLKGNMTYECIQRTNNFHDTSLTDTIVSASNIREKLEKKMDISLYLPEYSFKHITSIDETLYFTLLKFKILTENQLDTYLDVTEGLDNKLKKEIDKVSSLKELIERIKSKRYTYNRIKRMLAHILLGIRKEDANTKITYLHILGFTNKGKEYLNKEKKKFLLPFKIDYSSKIYQYEITASKIYELLTHSISSSFDKRNQPITPTLDKDSIQK